MQRVAKHDVLFITNVFPKGKYARLGDAHPQLVAAGLFVVIAE
jgi:hypothetical protein